MLVGVQYVQNCCYNKKLRILICFRLWGRVRCGWGLKQRVPLTVPLGALDADGVPLVELDRVALNDGWAGPHVELKLHLPLAHRHAHEVAVPIGQLAIVHQQTCVRNTKHVVT